MDRMVDRGGGMVDGPVDKRWVVDGLVSRWVGWWTGDYKGGMVDKLVDKGWWFMDGFVKSWGG